jgi:hypothetical protein
MRVRGLDELSMTAPDITSDVQRGGVCAHPRSWRMVAADRWLACGYCGAPLEHLPMPGA